MPNPSKTLFDPKLVTDLITKVRGKSSLAALSQQIPVEFVGNKEFIFSMDSDVDLVAENGKKSEGGISVDPITIIPLKFEYGARVSDEFLWASEEEKVKILEAFNDGFAKKLATGFDMAAMHKINPRTKVQSNLINSSIDGNVTQGTNYTGDDTDLETAIQAVEASGFNCNGIILGNTYRASLAGKRTSTGERLYPEFAFGAAPATLGAQRLSVNNTVEVAYKKTSSGTAATSDYAIVGDFDFFKWGYGRDISLEVIRYGDPDNSGKDLSGYNQVYIRAEAFLGWAVFDPAAFARVKNSTQPT